MDSPCSTLVDAGLGGDSEIRTTGGGCASWSIVGVDEDVDGASSRRRFEDAGVKKLVMLEFGIAKRNSNGREHVFVFFYNMVHNLQACLGFETVCRTDKIWPSRTSLKHDLSYPFA